MDFRLPKNWIHKSFFIHELLNEYRDGWTDLASSNGLLDWKRLHFYGCIYTKARINNPVSMNSWCTLFILWMSDEWNGLLNWINLHQRISTSFVIIMIRYINESWMHELTNESKNRHLTTDALNHGWLNKYNEIMNVPPL